MARPKKYTEEQFQPSRKFGEWSVIKSTLYRDGKSRAYVECKCNCGKIDRVPCHHLISGKSTRCKNCNESIVGRGGTKNPAWKGGKFDKIPSWKIKSIVAGADNRNIDFNVTSEYLYGLYESQSGCCAFTGYPLKLSSGNSYQATGTVTGINYANSGPKIYNASLDRINSNKGYVEGNVQWVVGRVNQMKSNMQDNEFISLCMAVAQKHQFKNSQQMGGSNESQESKESTED